MNAFARSKLSENLTNTNVGRSTYLTVGFVFLSATVFFIITRLGLLDHLAIYDELYHKLTALSWKETAQPTILDGQYRRALFYTIANASIFEYFNTNDIYYPRLILSVLPAALMCASIISWIYLNAGLATSALVAVFLGFWPLGIEVAQFNRFYAAHGLFLWIMIISTFAAFNEKRSPVFRLFLLFLSAISGAAAVGLQLISLVTVAGIFVWIAVFHFLPNLHPRTLKISYRKIAIAFVGLLSVLCIYYFFSRSIVYFVQLLHWDPTGSNVDLTYYSRRIREFYPIFWGISGFFLIISLLKLPKLTLFLATILFFQFLVISISSHKGDRFLFHIMPSIFVIWSVGLCGVFEHFRKLFITDKKDFRGENLFFQKHRSTALCLLVFSTIFCLATIPALTRSAGLISGEGGVTKMLTEPRLDWQTAAEFSMDVLEQGGVIVTNKELHAIEILGDIDFGFNKSRLAELNTNSRPFSLDPRIGRPLIDDVGSFEKIINCFPVGLFLVSDRWWWGSRLARKIEAMVRSRFDDTDLRIDGDFVMLVWRGDGEIGIDKSCQSLS